MWVSTLSGLDPSLEGSGVGGFPCGFVVGCLGRMEPFLGLNVSIRCWRLNWAGFVTSLRQNKKIYFSPLPGGGGRTRILMVRIWTSGVYHVSI